jgi:protein-disulfide isomerase
MSLEGMMSGNWKTCGLGLAATLCVLINGTSLVFAQAKQPGSRTVASVNNVPITQDELDKAAAGELERLEVQRLQSEANFTRNRYQALQTNLNRLIEGKLLAAAVAKSGVPEKDLLAKEVDAKLVPPTDQDIDAFYESNKVRINQPKEKVTSQIRMYLHQQAAAKARSDYMEQLKKEFGVVSYLEPLRIPIETAGNPSIGPADAPVVLVEFSDFQCSFCKALALTLNEVRSNYPTQIRLVYRQFPLAGLHPDATRAAEASLCAAEQNRFWELHDAMLGEQNSLSVEDLKAKAAKLQLDPTAFNACVDSGKYAQKVRQDLWDGYRAGVSGTPALFVNGRFLAGAQPYQDIAKIIDEELVKAGKKTTP